MKSKQIEMLLHKALLEEGEMAQSLYEYELEEHIDYWYEGLKADRDDFVFAVTENSGHVAMVLIMADKTVLINEVARAKLSDFWQHNYRANMEKLIPMMAKDLADDTLYVNGVRIIDRKRTKRVWGKIRP
jgi:predicted metal-dependent hydrolase